MHNPRLVTGKKTFVVFSFLLLLISLCLSGCTYAAPTPSISLDEVPAYSGSPFVEINGNQPGFTQADLTTQAFETYSDLDLLGRCGVAMANLGLEIMPQEERSGIGQIKPSGWHTIKYDIVDGKYLYNRCHLIGYQLSGENANEKNLITGTRYFNVQGMLPFENMVADYITETGNHVLYRVTPVFYDANLLASGVQIEALSVEDQGDGVCFNVFVYNVQPGISIDYADGASWLATDATPDNQNGDVQEGGGNQNGGSQETQTAEEIRGNSQSKIYHCPGQAFYERMADSDNLVVFHSEEEAIAAGYRKSQR